MITLQAHNGPVTVALARKSPGCAGYSLVYLKGPITRWGYSEREVRRLMRQAGATTIRRHGR